MKLNRHWHVLGIGLLSLVLTACDSGTVEVEDSVFSAVDTQFPDGGVHKVWDGRLSGAMIKVKIPEMDRVVALTFSDENGQFEFGNADKAIFLNYPRIVMLEITGGTFREGFFNDLSAGEFSPATLTALVYAPSLATLSFNISALTTAVAGKLSEVWERGSDELIVNLANEMALRIMRDDLSGNDAIDYLDVLMADSRADSNAFVIPYASLLSNSVENDGLGFERRLAAADPDWVRSLEIVLPDGSLSPNMPTPELLAAINAGVTIAEFSLRGIGRVTGDLQGRITGTMTLDPMNTWQKMKLADQDQLTLQAEPQPGYRFVEWSSGCPQATGDTCVVTRANYTEPVVATYAVSDEVLKAGVPNAAAMSKELGSYSAVLNGDELTLSVLGPRNKALDVADTIQAGSFIETGIVTAPYMRAVSTPLSKSLGGNFHSVALKVEPVDNLAEVFDRISRWGTGKLTLEDVTAVEVPMPGTELMQKVLLDSQARQPLRLADNYRHGCPLYGATIPILQMGEGQVEVRCLPESAEPLATGDYCPDANRHASLDGRSYCSAVAPVQPEQAQHAASAKSVYREMPQPKMLSDGRMLAAPVWLQGHGKSYHLGDGRYLVHGPQGGIQLMVATSDPVPLAPEEAHSLRAKMAESCPATVPADARLGDFAALCNTETSLYQEIAAVGANLSSLLSGNGLTAVGFDFSLELAPFTVNLAVALDLGSPSLNSYFNIDKDLGDVANAAGCAIQDFLSNLATSAANWLGVPESVTRAISSVASAASNVLRDVFNGVGQVASAVVNTVSTGVRSVIRGIGSLFGGKSAPAQYSLVYTDTAWFDPEPDRYRLFLELPHLSIAKNCLLGDIGEGLLGAATYLNPLTAAVGLATGTDLTDVPVIFEAGVEFKGKPRPAAGLRLARGVSASALREFSDQETQTRAPTDASGNRKRKSSDRSNSFTPIRVDFAKLAGFVVLQGELGLEVGVEATGEVFLDQGLVLPIDLSINAGVNTAGFANPATFLRIPGLDDLARQAGLSDLVKKQVSGSVSHTFEMTGGALLVIEPYVMAPKLTMGITAVAMNLVKAGPRLGVPLTFYATNFRLFAGDSTDVQKIINADGGNRRYCVATGANIGVKADLNLELLLEMSLRDSLLGKIFSNPTVTARQTLFSRSLFNFGFNPTPADAADAVLANASRLPYSPLPSYACPGSVPIPSVTIRNNTAITLQAGQSFSVDGAEIANENGSVIIYEVDASGARTGVIIQQLFSGTQPGTLTIGPAGLRYERPGSLGDPLFSGSVQTFNFPAQGNANTLVRIDKNGLRLQLPDGTIISERAFANSDFDDDGVLDRLDQCPLTPANTPVDQLGCPSQL